MNLKLSGIGLVAITAVLLLPGSFGNIVADDTTFWGQSSLVAYDVEGNEILSQTIHNRIVDTGEQFILGQTFKDGNTNALDNVSMGTICAFTNATGTEVTIEEDITATDVDTTQKIDQDLRCNDDDGVTSLATPGKAIIGPITFTGGALGVAEVTAGETIHGIAICQQNNTGTTWIDCTNGGGVLGAGIMLAIIDTSDVTLNNGETVDITYTFDITSPSD